MRAKVLVIGVVLGIVLSSAVVVLAGSLDPPSGPTDAASQMYTMAEIYQRLDGGVETSKMTSFTEPSSGPGAGTMRTLDQIMSVAPKVDDTNGATAEDVVNGKTFWGLTTGEWGQMTGTAANPDPPCFDNGNRYVDCGNGTVHDTVTNLIWLKDANCFLTKQDWTAANNAAAGLEDGECGLTDGSSPGDWRLPTEAEWSATVARAAALGCTDPLLTNKPGTVCFNVAQPAFNNVQFSYYWGSTAREDNPTQAWVVNLKMDNDGYISKNLASSSYVWPIRGGQ